MQESIVYGCITDTSPALDVERRRQNRLALAHLPANEAWQFLNREMFSVPDHAQPRGDFITEVMHFGSSYGAIEYEWDEWIKQFEALLNKMYWVSATVHLETELRGTHSFVWTPDGDHHRPGSDAMSVKCEWLHETSY